MSDQLGEGFISGLVSGIFSKILTSTPGEYWYDYYNSYFDVDVQYTKAIDRLLMNPKYGVVSVKIFRNNTFSPSYGVHYYYINTRYWEDLSIFNPKKTVCYIRENICGYIGLIKKPKDNTQPSDYYKIFVPFFNTGIVNSFIPQLTYATENQISIMHVDFSDNTARISSRYESFSPGMRQNQTDVVSHICRKFNDNPHKNHKIMISGTRGLGKTYIAKFVKKILDLQNRNCQLFTSVDPTQVGFDIVSSILANSSNESPVIVVINEIDKVYENVFVEKNMFDGRTQHTRTKSTFNDLLDAFGSAINCIVIFSTEINHVELRNNEEYKSFMRHGRVDTFAHMTADAAVITANASPVTFSTEDYTVIARRMFRLQLS